MKKLRVAIIGQGRSGRNIHGAYFLSELNEKYEVVACVDEIPLRRLVAEERHPGCKTFADYKELFNIKDEIDIVVNASYSQYHYEISKDLLSHGMNVVAEKPFARTYEECLDLIETAKQNNCHVYPFHQTLFAPNFLKVKEVLESGKIGTPVQYSLRYSGFSHRWDWQTILACCAGGLYNTAPHPIGQALDLLGWDEKVEIAYSKLASYNVSGDGDDYAKIILEAPGKAPVDIEVISCSDAYPDFIFKIYGTNGTFQASYADFKMTYYKPEEYTEHQLQKKALKDENGNPIYCADDMKKYEESGEITGSAFNVGANHFYNMVYGELVEGKKAYINPEKGALAIKIIEECHKRTPLERKVEL